MAAYSSVLTDYLGEGLSASLPVSLNIAPGALGLYYGTDSNDLFLWNSSMSSWGTVSLTPGVAAVVGNSHTVGTGGTLEIGANLTLTAAGTLNAVGGGSVTAVVAGTGLEVGAGPGGTITSSGTLNVTAATTTALGGVIVGAGLGVTSGTLSNSGVLQFGTDTGTIHIAAGLQEASNTLSLNLTGVGVSISSGTLTVDPIQANFDFAGAGTAWPAAVFVPVIATVVVGATFAGTQLFNGTAATGTVDVATSYIHSGTTTSIGNLIFAPGGPTLGSSSAVTLVPGNVLKFAPSTTADATAADLCGAVSLSRVGP